MSSGSIDKQERAELEAAERGIRLARPATYQREYTDLTPGQVTQASPTTIAHLQQLEDEHQRIHQATVEYLYCNAIGERITQRQVADTYDTTKDMIRWRLKMYRGYSERLAQRQQERTRLREEQEEQARTQRTRYYLLDEQTHTPLPVENPDLADMHGASPVYGITNVDISDDEEPYLYIQRYHYPKRTYRVIRKVWDEDTEGVFIPDPDYSEKYWPVNFTITEYDPEDDVPEVFALVDRDEECPPIDDPEDMDSQGGDPCLLLVYDEEDQRFKCERCDYGDGIEEVDEQDEQALDQIAEPTLRAALDQAVALLDRLIERSLRKRPS